MNSRTKLRTKYPLAFKKCIPEALVYGKCATTSIDLKHNECEKEFKNLNNCFQKAIKSIK